MNTSIVLFALSSVLKRPQRWQFIQIQFYFFKSSDLNFIIFQKHNLTMACHIVNQRTRILSVGNERYEKTFSRQNGDKNVIITTV